ncbi:MAG: DNA adenine methylase [Actinobacteria bacterium]|nr:DNA adenine methylase [Actinomycetota bacterium]MDQ3533585.1 DNA adenine methylase [Actinomycetota bacterium]
MIKYIGSKRRLVPQIGAMFSRMGAASALDLFAGTTRVAQELKRRGANVCAVDTARYSEVLAQCYIACDAAALDRRHLADAMDFLQGLQGEDGYFTETYCRRARFFQPSNGRKVDAIRNALDSVFSESALYPILLTSLIEAADRVDSTTGVQMAYLKKWAPRSYNELELRVPDLLSGRGVALRADATRVVALLPHVDFAYLDPPYNQHSYFSNYHVWETLVAWDRPVHYGVACKRLDCKEPSTRSVFNSKREIKAALQGVITELQADIVVLSYNDEAWMGLDELVELCAARGEVEVLSFESKRYVGAQIGIYNPVGDKVGRVSHVRNLEYLIVSGQAADVRRVAHAAAAPAVCPA